MWTIATGAILAGKPLRISAFPSGAAKQLLEAFDMEKPASLGGMVVILVSGTWWIASLYFLAVSKFDSQNELNQEIVKTLKSQSDKHASIAVDLAVIKTSYTTLRADISGLKSEVNSVREMVSDLRAIRRPTEASP